MKKYFTLLTMFSLIIFIGIFSPTYGQWNKYVIDKNLDGALDLFVIDMNNDGNLDVVASGVYANAVVWYEAPSWTKHIIDENLKWASDLYVADMNGDDTLDVIAAGESENVVLWYEAPLWKKNLIDNNLEGARDVQVADMDGDDDLDVVATGMNANKVVWYEAPLWEKHLIDNNLGGARHVLIADMDGDDTLDVVATGKTENDVVWYKYKAPSWIKYYIDDNLEGARGLYVSDLDGDGDLDVVAAGSEYATSKVSDLVWYEAPLWTKHSVDDNLIGARQVYVADMDNDNDLDIVVAAWQKANDVLWYEAPYWTKHFIDNDLKSTRCVYVSDMDNDDDLDVIATGAIADNVVWYENLGKNTAYGKLIECNIDSQYISPDGDSVVVNAKIVNSESHPATLHAIIEGSELTYKDSLQLNDDGLHGDAVASDNIWSGVKWLSGLEEDMYSVKLRTQDLTVGTIHYLYMGLPLLSNGQAKPFTTIGPVTATAIDDHDELMANRHYIRLILQNEGKVTTARNLKVTISTSDPRVKEKEFTVQSFQELAPRISDTAKNFSTYFYYEEGYGPDSTVGNPIQFDYTVSSDEIPYWTGSFTFSSTIVGVQGELENNIPQKFALEQNYPNPFNPSTTIKYQIPSNVKSETANVKLVVYDILGREVATLVNQKQKPGYYEVEWIADDQPSGVYFYRLETTTGFAKTKKLVLLK